MSTPYQASHQPRIVAPQSAEAAAPQRSSLPPHAPLVMAADVTQPQPPTVQPNAHLAAAVYLMKHASTTAVVVVADEQSSWPLVLITQADIAQAEADGKDPNDARIYQHIQLTRPGPPPVMT